MADQRRPPRPRCPVRGDEGRRINLERRARIGRDIGTGARRVHAQTGAQQQAANLGIRTARRVVQYSLQRSA